MFKTLYMCLLCLLCPLPALATCLFTWTPPTTNVDGTELTDLVGYRLYTASTPDGFTLGGDPVKVSAVPQIETPCVADAYWVVTAVNASGNESGFSNVLFVDVTLPSPPTGLSVKITVTVTTTIDVEKP